jgi:hypothetical protein
VEPQELRVHQDYLVIYIQLVGYQHQLIILSTARMLTFVHSP